MKARGVIFSRRIALALFCMHMHNHRLWKAAHTAEIFFEFFDIMPVKRPHILKAQVREEIARKEHALDRAFEAVNEFSDVVF